VTPQYICTDLKRRQSIRAKPSLNGIDFLEVLDQEAASIPLPEGVPPGSAVGSPRQQTLVVRFFAATSALTEDNLRIEGGVRVTSIGIVWARPASTVTSPQVTLPEQAFFRGLPEPDKILIIRTDVVGDFSTYTLRVVESPSKSTPPATFDSRFVAIDFSFKVECPSDFDCQTVEVCPPVSLQDSPAIDYLAKDFSSFRTLMLDRLAVAMPSWQETSPADMGTALVEVLAYAADRLSYFQDAVATEAYLGTARRRVSVRRHARLLDYAMHDGSNARAWVHIVVGADVPLLPPGTPLLTQINEPRGALPNDKVQVALDQQAIAFETLHKIELFVAHNRMEFYTWGDDVCYLPKGATEATLADDGSDGAIQLVPGDAVLFEEVRSPSTGVAADADPAHRWVVRLTNVARTPSDSIGGKTTPVVEITWAADDALPFPLCISTAGIDQSVSVARGNIVLADHGHSIAGEPVPFVAGRFSPRLQNTGITFSTPYDGAAAAANSLTQDPRAAAPQVTLFDDDSNVWKPLPDLLETGPFSRNFIVETEDDGTARLRFGDGLLGEAPTAALFANYRTGNGSAGHVGAEAIAHVVTDLPGIKSVRNPLPSQGGIDPEPAEQVRLYAPHAFRTQERAVTEADYAAVAGRHPEVEKAEASLRSTGTWYTMFVTVQRRGGQPVDSRFRDEVRNFLEPFRLAGFDLEVEGPVFVALDIAFTVRVAAGYFQSAVEEALLEAFSNRDLPDGRRGFFHPDNFTFGQPVYLSPMVAAAMQLPGVLWVDTSDRPPNRFSRFGEKSHGELDAGRISTARLEIARLDNDPNEPENGVIQFFMEGGL
jgi:hypothetical protein